MSTERMITLRVNGRDERGSFPAHRTLLEALCQIGHMEVECVILESRGGVGPYGAKGIDEPVMTAVAPAIANAVADAIGVRVFEMPITPERVVTALKQRDEAGRAGSPA